MSAKKPKETGEIQDGARGCGSDEEEELNNPHVANPRCHPKDPRTNAKYNIISRLLFLWMDPLFWLGARHTLEQSDLYAHPQEADSEKLLRRFNRIWAHELERKKWGRNARLWWAIIKCLWFRLFVQGVLNFLEVVLLTSQSLILGLLTNYFTIEDPTDEETRNAYLYAAGLVLAAIVITMIHTHAFLLSQKVGMMARIISTAAIYQKILRMSQVTLGDISVGHVVNLASNDVQRFDLAFVFIHFLWISPIHLAVFTYLVYNEVGWSAFIATGFIVLQVPLQIMSAKLFAKLRLRSALITDNRVKVMNEIITGMRVIKMYAWEYAFKGVVTKLRSMESRVILMGGTIRALEIGYYQGFGQLLLTFIIFVSFTSAGGSLSTQAVFTVLSLVVIIRRTAIGSLMRGIITLTEATVAFKRVQKFLELDELSADVDHHAYFQTPLDGTSSGMKRSSPDIGVGSNTTSSQVNSPGISLSSPVPEHERRGKGQPLVVARNLSASWTYENDNLVLSNLSFEVNQDSRLLAVVGPVGAGKSSLLQCILGELRPVGGSVEVCGQLSYASQQPWVYSNTLRENILFGQPFCHRWYESVLKACSLDKDVEQLVYGDLTLVGERGVTLSGGQRARVSLARAVYRDVDIYLLDDPLSAVDTAVARHLFQKVICGLLKNKLVVLVTHQVQFAQQASKILAIKDGKVEVYGSHEELVARGVDPTMLLGLKSEDEEEDEFAVRGDEDDEEEEVDEFVDRIDEDDEAGEVDECVVRMDEDDGDEDQAEVKEVAPRPQEGIPTWLSPDWNPRASFRIGSRFRSRSESIAFDTASIYSAPSMLSLDSAIDTDNRRHDSEAATSGHPAEEKAHGSITMATYYRYFKAGGNVLFLIVVLVAFILGEASIVVSDWWLSDWAECSEIIRMRDEDNSISSYCSNMNTTLMVNCSQEVDNDKPRPTCELSDNERIGIYTGTTGFAIIINFARAIMFYVVCVNASRVLHNRMFASVLRAPIYFFDTNPIGRVLNRFSRDVGFLDDLLPYQFCEFLMLLLRFFAIIIIASSSNPWVFIPAVVVMVAFLALRSYYLKTSRGVKRLEAIARSPLYSHISTTLQGLSTIRTFKEEGTAMGHFHRYQNEHTQGWYLYLVTTRWFGMRIDTLSTLFLASVAFSSIPLASTLNAGLVALGLTYTLSLAGMFQYCVRLSASVENVMISAERVMAYGRLESEASLETLPPSQKPPPTWPSEGGLEMDEVSFRYANNLPLVLKSLSFSVKPSEKIGIVGRTGAGKSSLLSVLYRLAEPFGVITIDGVNTKEIGLHDIRRNISIIPQDPVLFSGTLRYNLDPFDEYTDIELWNVLEQVQLKQVVESLEGQLQGKVAEGGSNFSVGQRQLVCLARALLRNNKILVLDEATANVDIKTDSIIQQAIREEFSDCTVLTIAHRLNTIMDSDRILVLNKGQVKEYDRPYALLRRPRSQFKRMVEQTGPTASRKLYQMAFDAQR